jgi:type III secretion protein U
MKGDSKEKTEQPTAKKLRDARKKGSVAKSSDIASACTFMVIVVMLGLFHKNFSNCVKDIFELIGNDFHLPLKQSLLFAATVTLKNILLFILPIFTVVIGVVIVVHVLQFGFIASADPITPQFDKINPVEGFKRIFSLKNLVEGIKSVVKLVLLGVILFFTIKDALSYLAHLPDWGLDGITRAWFALTIKISVIAAVFFMIIALFDVFLQKRLFRRQNKMSKDEVIREFKDTEGNPMIKGQRRSFYQNLLSAQTARRAEKATVIITNPEHYAVALYYKRNLTDLPIVMTKGENSGARKIIKIAEKANVPVVRNVAVARALYAQVHIGDYISGDLIEPVAEIIRWVFMNSPGAAITG